MSSQLRPFVVLLMASMAGACGNGNPSTNNNANNNTSGGNNEADAAPAVAAEDAAPAVDAEPPPPPPPAMAKLRVIHASPAPQAASVNVFLDNGSTPAISALAYKAVWGYNEVPAGTHAIAVRPAAAAADSPPAISGSADLVAGHSYTVIAHGLAAGTPALALAPAEDTGEAPEAGNARLRFFHALAGVGAVDVCAAGATARAASTAIFANVAYGAWGSASGGAYATVPTNAAAILEVRAMNARPCTGRVAGYVSMPAPPDRAVATAVAVGNTARGGATKELLVCTDVPTAAPNSTCQTLAIVAARPRAPAAAPAAAAAAPAAAAPAAAPAAAGH